MNTQTYSVWGGLIAVPVVVLLNALLIWVVARRHQPWLMRVMAWGYLAKLAGITMRYLVLYVLYDGGGDAERYNLYAAANYRLWREGAFVWEPGGKQGTQVLELITTTVYALTGPSPFAGFVVFGSLAYWGIYLLYRAFATALPAADHRRYALLVFLLPSVLYWPSSIGKEAWLLLFVGVTSLGAAHLFTQRPTWLLLLTVGGLGTALVRPHMAVLLVTSLVVAQVLRPASTKPLGVLSKVGGLVVMAAAALLLTQQSAEFLGIDDLTAQGVIEEIGWASGQTAQGGSSFTPVPLTNPLGVPVAFVTLLFRPFPWESGNIQMLAQSLEGLFVLGLVVASFSRWRGVWRSLTREPYLAFSLTYVVAFVLAFSQFANFGILARQRVLMLPLVLVLLALPKATLLADRPTEEVTRDVTVPG
ncbi:hypothetical protein [Aestuariimicrobium ganziense]|uniref:hypothetical protein n=1 Tax=Aestuariimicrobium ganziense TaxID=2773677 RepID=UPI0019440538|nr:hypothetical protein [Aestuariimicrobium ganziense]